MIDLISICIPTFNGKKFVQDSILSARAQDYGHLEILIIDDLSEDGTWEVIKYQANQDKRIRAIRNESNLGLVANWNKCIKEAKGSWVKFLFQDDLMTADCCSKMFQFARHHRLNVVLSKRAFFSKSINDQDTVEPSSSKEFYHNLGKTRVLEASEVARFFTNDFLGSNFIGEPIIGLVNKSIFDNFGTFNSDLRQIADFEFWLRISLNESLGFINETINFFRVHDESESARNNQNRTISFPKVDRITLGLLLMNSSYYKGYRAYLMEQGFSLKTLIVEKFTKYITAMGYFKSRKYVNRGAFRYFHHSLYNLKRAIQKDLNG